MVWLSLRARTAEGKARQTAGLQILNFICNHGFHDVRRSLCGLSATTLMNDDDTDKLVLYL